VIGNILPCDNNGGDDGGDDDDEDDLDTGMPDDDDDDDDWICCTEFEFDADETLMLVKVLILLGTLSVLIILLFLLV
jgi:hypothetical protein